jgi:hypothetical protein
MTDNTERLPCTYCGQDWQTCYRVCSDGRMFLLCPECDSVWLPGDDRRKAPVHQLTDLFPPHMEHEVWMLIERCDSASNR